MRLAPFRRARCEKVSSARRARTSSLKLECSVSTQIRYVLVGEFGPMLVAEVVVELECPPSVVRHK